MVAKKQRSDVTNSHLRLTAMASTSEPPNSLGLDFDQLKIQDTTETESKPEDPPQSPSQDAAEPAEKKKPYVNPERVKTGGNQRVCRPLCSVENLI